MNNKIYSEIKNKFIDIEVNKRTSEYINNKYDLSKYYEIGKLILEAQGGEEKAKYGNYIINELSIYLTAELGKGYSTRTLKRIRKFYLFQKGTPLVAQLSWTHYTILLSLDNDNEIRYYINKCISDNLSKRKLSELIKSDEYNRLPESAKSKLSENNALTIYDEIKNPIIVRNDDRQYISEKILHSIILKDLDSFMKQLGTGYSYVGNEYPIKIGNRYNYIDLLLYNYIYNCFIVIELKVTELKKDHIGQIQTYMNYIDKNLKTINQDNTIGIIICKKDNKFIMQYCSDDRILSREYRIE